MPEIGERVWSPWGACRYLGTAKVFGGIECRLGLAWFVEGVAPAILAFTEAGEPMARISVNVCGILDLEPWSFVVHHDLADMEGVVLRSCGGVFEDTGRRVDYGFVKGRPVWRVGAAVIAALSTTTAPG